LLLLCGVIGCSSNNYETRPFFQHEYEVEAHGRKTFFDHLVELDPGTFKVKVAPDYLADPPATIAVLPFTDVGSANVVVDKVPLTFRNRRQRENWTWTHAQRLRRALDGYLAQREFLVANLDGVDAVLQARGIDTAQKLFQIPPQELGQWLGVDAVVYGSLRNYEAYYLGLIAAWRVGLQIKMISTHSGSPLVEAAGMRYDTNLLMALSVEDIVISSVENLLQPRDINLARSEEETCREIVHRIPISQALRKRNQEAALVYASSSDHRIADSDVPVWRTIAAAPQ